MAFITSWRIKDRQRFFASLLPPHAFCFDIGANHGEYTATFLSLGARRVVAVEPLSEVAQFVGQTFSNEIQSGALVIRAQAVGSEKGVAKLFPAQDVGKSMSTLSKRFVEISRANGLSWDDAAIEVDVITLDSGATAEHAVVGPHTLIAFEFAATSRSRRQCGWEIVLSNKSPLAHGDSATLEDAKRDAEAALRGLLS
jgi:FkbM family methyltransferase